MRYRVVFSKRFQSDGQESSIDPTAELDSYLSDGVVAEKVFVSRVEPLNAHSQEVFDEDDAFLGMSGSEQWEYEVVNERDDEFHAAVENSQVVMELEIIDESETTEDEAVGVTLSSGADKVGGQRGQVPVSEAGSGVQALDDGPAGMPTGDPSAGGLGSGGRSGEFVEGIGMVGSGGIDDLTILDAEDPTLGLTNIGDVPADDWAADTGPDRAPRGNIEALDIREEQRGFRQAEEERKRNRERAQE